ncbi:MAG: DASH family cryptochrome [Bacteroidota bacterium]
MSKVQILWFRNDLRLRDHVALNGAAEEGPVIPVYVVPNAWNGKSREAGLARMSARRKAFLRECLADLRQSLQERGSELIVRTGRPAQVLADLAEEVGAEAVHYTFEPADQERRAAARVKQALAGVGVECYDYDGATLYYSEDLPFPASQTPDTFSKFRGKVEKYGEVQPPVTIPTLEAPATWPDAGNLPEVPQVEADPRAVLPFKGGETAALERLMAYCGPKGPLREYKETRNGLLGADYSSKFSPWLATGCISPRTIYAQVRRYEEAVIKNKSTYWLIFELLWREYFRFWTERHGNSLFQFAGPRNAPYKVHPQQESRFQAWIEGQTGAPLIDANMIELSQTGFMSNRGRQIVASFLVKDLGVNWTWGAEYFESQLLDYDVCSNWGNWTYVAGVGADPRQDRYFHTLVQADRYDGKGAYVRHWIPELKAVPDGRVHTVFAQPVADLQRWNVSLGDDYPMPVVVPQPWRKNLPKSYTARTV